MPEELKVKVGDTVWPTRGDVLEKFGRTPVTVSEVDRYRGDVWLVVTEGTQFWRYPLEDFSTTEPTVAVTPTSAPGATPREEILEEAARTIMGPRRNTYGDAQESFDRIAALWSAILRHHVTATEVALCMAALKISRAVGAPDHRDSFVDLAGYAALAFELDPPLPGASS